MTGQAQDEPKPIDKDSPEKLAKILAMMGASEEGLKNNAAVRAAELLKRRPDLAQDIAANLSYITGGEGKPTPAELERQRDEAVRKYEDALDANATYEAQNAAIRDAYEKKCRPGVVERIARAGRRLVDIFTPAASASPGSTSTSTSRKGFLSAAFAATATGIGALAAMKTGVASKDVLAIAAVVVLLGTAVSLSDSGVGSGILDDDDDVDSGLGTVLTAGASVGAGAAGVSGTLAVAAHSTWGAIAAFSFVAILSAVSALHSLGSRNRSLMKVLAGTLAGAALSTALVFSAVSGAAPDKPASPAASESSAIERTVPAP